MIHTKENLEALKKKADITVYTKGTGAEVVHTTPADIDDILENQVVVGEVVGQSYDSESTDYTLGNLEFHGRLTDPIDMAMYVKEATKAQVAQPQQTPVSSTVNPAQSATTSPTAESTATNAS